MRAGSSTADETSAPVDLDQLFNTLDPKTRAGLQKFITGPGRPVPGQALEDAAEALKYLSPALNTTSRLTRELIADDAGVRALPDRHVEGGGRDRRAPRRARPSWWATRTPTFGAIGDENEALSRALALLPSTLRKANTTFVNLRAALEDLDVLVAESKPATKDLAPSSRACARCVEDARPTVRDLRELIRTPGQEQRPDRPDRQAAAARAAHQQRLPARDPDLRPLAGVRRHAAPLHARPGRLAHEVRPGRHLLRRQRPLRARPADLQPVPFNDADQRRSPAARRPAPRRVPDCTSPALSGRRHPGLARRLRAVRGPGLQPGLEPPTRARLMRRLLDSRRALRRAPRRGARGHRRRRRRRGYKVRAIFDNVASASPART